MKKKDLEIVLKHAFCATGEERFCELCTLRSTSKCDQGFLCSNELYDVVIKYIKPSSEDKDSRYTA